MIQLSAERPNWNLLFETAAAQQGLFTTEQAAEAGYSPQLLVHYIRNGRAVRLQRGIYRLVHFPASDNEELVSAWLWSERAGVVSHNTALFLHGLSDILPSRIHLALPSAWHKRRFRVPKGLVLCYADVPPDERTWFGSVPVTAPVRSLNDCARAALSPELLRQAAQQALHRGLVKKVDLQEVKKALKPFGGLPS